MKHYGDITKLSGYDLPIVDVITGGSPCQDLSVAGKRAGLAGERSGLFMEQMRIVKEMRNASRRTDKYIRPRYMVFENVPGALSSNDGKDWQTVLTEIVRVARPDAPDVPLFGGGGQRWPKAGCLMGYGEDGSPFSIAWRVHDAQFWGVAQRRRRIALVADYRGLSATEICFERKGLSGRFEESEKQGQDITARTGTSLDQTVMIQMTSTENAVVQDGISPTLTARMGTGGNQVNAILCNCKNESIVRRLTPTECERLQGFPDGWTDIGDWVDSKGKKRSGGSESPRYKALGNSIALPFWQYLARRICAMYERDITIGSLFDGIGGFPLVFERCGAKAVWASEIEEFPIAVTEKHFGKDGDIQKYL